MTNIAIATCREWPFPAGDDPLRREVEARGYTLYSGPWNGAQQPFHEADLVLIRGCWDYYKTPQAFLAWIAALADRSVRIRNRPEMLRWNLDKRYLLELKELGITIPETVVVDPKSNDTVLEEMTARGWTQAVLKPTIGQSGHFVERLDVERFEMWPECSIPTPQALLQEFQIDISSLGETMLVFFGGHFSHALQRKIAPGEWRSNSQYGSSRERCEVSSNIVKQAQRALSIFARPPLYARVDGLVKDEQFVLMELELIEPELGFREVPEAAMTFCNLLDELLR